MTLYTRKDCAPCDQAKSDLAALQARIPHRLVEVDIDSDLILSRKYAQVVPVVEVGPYSLKTPFNRQKLEMTLGAAGDRQDQLQKIGGELYESRLRRGQTLSSGDRISFWMSKYYLTVLNLALLLYVGLPFLAPTLMKMGAPIPAQVIYRIYSPLCHQFAFRSFFLFGEQPYYPLTEAGLKAVRSFEQVSGLDGLDNPASLSRLEARRFLGDENVGYKVALCERDVAIYGALLLFGIFFGLSGRRLPPLHWFAWILLGIGPIAVDGFSQLFSQFNWPWLAAILPYRESTPFLRVLTGVLFGWMTAWYAYPYMEQSMRETRQILIKKTAIAQAVD